MITINSVKNPRWGNGEKTILIVDADFDEIEDEFVPFSTSEDADTEHGLEIWNKGKAGEYGEIANYQAPVFTANDLPLNRFQFEALVLSIGLSISQIEQTINSLPISAFDKAVAISRLRNAEIYNRDHPLVEQVRTQMNMSVKDLDDNWIRASQIR